MALNSVNTNNAAMIALQSLNRTADQLGVTEKQISTGYRVSDAKDDGAAFAVAQTIRADQSGLTSANEQLGGAKGVLDTTLASLGQVSDTMKTLKGVLVKLADGTLNTDERAQYTQQYTDLRTQMTNFIADATYNGRTLLDVTAANGGGNIVTVRNEAATTLTLTAVDGAGTLIPAAAPATAAAAQTALAAGGNFDTTETAINTAQNTFGSNSNYVDSQITYNKNKLDALSSGLGALIDADLSKEAAMQQALQTKQQLGTQALSIANQAPQALLSLFK